MDWICIVYPRFYQVCLKYILLQRLSHSYHRSRLKKISVQETEEKFSCFSEENDDTTQWIHKELSSHILVRFVNKSYSFFTSVLGEVKGVYNVLAPPFFHRPFFQFSEVFQKIIFCPLTARGNPGSATASSSPHIAQK